MIKFNRKFWLYNLGVWSVVALFTATQLYFKSLQSEQPGHWLNTFWIQLAVWWVWAFITPVIFRLAEKRRIGKGNFSNALTLLLISIGLVALYLGIYVVIWLFATYKAISDEGFVQLYKVLFVNLFHWHFFICMAIIAFVHAYLYYRDSEEERVRGVQLEKELVINQLRMLKMQIQPHFLFNTLNSIVSAIHQQKTAVASEMTTGLSELLRISLNENGRVVVSLEEELDYVQKYLQIEQHRFKNAKVKYEIQEEALWVEVPNFFLQPIVENAVKHGIAKGVGAQLLKISIRLVENNRQLQIDIYNEGPSLTQDQGGIGLQNVRQRLHAHYGDAASLKLYNLDNGVNTQINLPAL
jgi:signal transduction histidine kinase